MSNALVNVTSTLYIKDTGLMGCSANMHGHFTVHHDHVEIHASGPYRISVFDTHGKHQPITIETPRGDYSLNMDNFGGTTMDLSRGEKVRFVYGDYSVWLHNAWIIMIKIGDHLWWDC